MKIRTDFVTNSSSSSFVCFRIKNEALAHLCLHHNIGSIDYNASCDTVISIGAGGRWQFENALNMDTPQGSSIALWFAELLTQYCNSDDNVKKACEEILTKRKIIDDDTKTLEIEIGDIVSDDNGSGYRHETRKGEKITMLSLSDSEWDSVAAHAPMWDQLSGDTKTLRAYARKIGNQRVIEIKTSPQKPKKVELEHILPKAIPYDPALVKMDDWVYKKKKDGSLELTEYWGNDSIVYIPEKIDGSRVVIIGKGLFRENQAIKSVIMPDTIIAVETEAFHCAWNLQYAGLSQNLEKIGKMAFSSVDIACIEIPASVTAINGGALYAEKLRNVVIHGDPEISTNLRVFAWEAPPAVHAHKGGNVEAYCKKMDIEFFALD